MVCFLQNAIRYKRDTEAFIIDHYFLSHHVKRQMLFDMMGLFFLSNRICNL